MVLVRNPRYFMKDAAGNRGRAAELLRVSYKALLVKLKEHGIDS